MKKILFIFTNYRTSEKIYPIIKLLSNEYHLDLYLMGEMHPKTPWYGTNDLRVIFNLNYKQYFENILYGEFFNFHGDRIKESPLNNLNLKKYDGIILDDNKIMTELRLSDIYNEAKKMDIPIIGTSHGNQNYNKNNLLALNNTFDYIVLLGQKEFDFYSKYYDSNKLLIGGIPSNDLLVNYSHENKYVLCIVNFLGNRNSPFRVRFDRDFILQSKLIEISESVGLPITIKLKSRLDRPQINEDIEYVKQQFKNLYKFFDIVVDGDNNEIISKSGVVISAPSTLSFKSIQMGIPTIIIPGAGQIGNLNNFRGLTSTNIIENISNQFNMGKDINFIKNTIKGGIDFTSTNIYTSIIKKIMG